MALEVLNASAGSGKTYNLVQTYLKLLLLDDHSAGNFAQVMAMTFTNKAAFEMKERIVLALDFIANSMSQDQKNQSKALELIEVVSSILNIKTEILQKRAKNALKQILHQFEDFHVMTIDKFNLRLIRSFSKELNIANDFRIVLNEEEVLDEVVETLLDNIDEHAKTALTKLVLNYSKEKLEGEESWNFQRELKKFASILTNEKYFKQVENLLQNDFSPEALQQIKYDIKHIEDTIREKAESLYDNFKDLDVSKLPGKSNNTKAFIKLVNDKLLEAADENGGFFSPTMLNNFEKSTDKGDCFPSDLVSQALDFQEFYRSKIKEYFILKEAVKNFYNLALLQFISKELEGVRSSEHIIRISEFNKLISDLIKDENAPFIYERLGNRFKHFLLDEFQDTSRLQWMNIIPLVHESLANSHDNLIVGDAKQSIYRFKNGLAEQFVALPEIYNPELDKETAVKSSFFNSQGFKRVLEDNYRSRKKIVQFNNSFFEQIRSTLAPNFQSFYDDVFQNPKGKDGGYIEIHSKEIEKSDDDQLNTMLLEWVENILSDGYECGDICILGSTKKECNSWAIELSKRYKVVSDDSLLVNSDQYVRLSISYLKWRLNPSGELEAKRFSDLYFSCFSENPLNDQRIFWKEYVNPNTGKKSTYFASNEFIRSYFVSDENFFFRYDNLYSLIQGFYRLVHISELNNPYLHHLSDMLFEFDLSNGPELDLFIETYESKGKDSSIQIPDNREAIKIMTGHKSKGLEFPIVILPNMDFSLDSKKSKFLIQQGKHFFYTGLSKNSKIDNIRWESEKEESQIYLDKMNLCYVMMTRPVDRLYIGNLHLGKSKNKFGFKFHDALSKLQDIKHVDSIFSFGERTSHQHTTLTDGEEANFRPLTIQDQLWFPDISLNAGLLEDDEDLSDARRYGNQLHEVLSLLHNLKDMKNLLVELISTSKIELEFQERIEVDLVRIFSNQAYIELLENAQSITNEQTILIGKYEAKRPDKIIFKEKETIVIDFKSGLQTNKNEKQVKLYKKVLQEMGFPNVKGFLYYTTNLDLIEIA